MTQSEFIPAVARQNISNFPIKEDVNEKIEEGKLLTLDQLKIICVKGCFQHQTAMWKYWLGLSEFDRLRILAMMIHLSAGLIMCNRAQISSEKGMDPVPILVCGNDA